MRKLWLTLLCTLAVLGTATVSEAKIFVKISDGTNTLDGLGTATIPALFKLSQNSATRLASGDQTDTLTILQCTIRPCTVFFPSGQATEKIGTDTFKIQDACLNPPTCSSISPAKVTVLDAFTASDRVSLSGFKITSTTLGVGKTLTVTFGTQTGDLRTLTSAQASAYTVSAAFSGFFAKTLVGGLPAARANACKAGTATTDMDDASDACVRLSMALNGTGVDGQGSAVSATIAVACNNSFPTLNPCGTNGSWTAATGAFSGVNDGRSISCPNGCSPAQVATLTAKFTVAANETLQLTNSGNGVMSNVTDQDGGVEEAAIALADEVPLNRWVTTSPKSEKCFAVPKAPTTNDTRNITNKSSLPISFEYWCGEYAPAGAEGVPLISLADSALIPGAAGAKYMASRETFLATRPTQSGPQLGLMFKGILTLTLNYQVVTGQEQIPTDTRLDSLVTYSDCRDGSIRLEIQLEDSSGVDKGTMKVYLGNDPNLTAPAKFKNGCVNFDGPIVDIRNNTDARVDASQILVSNPPQSLVTFGSLQNGTIGNLFVRKIAFIVGRPESGDTLDENFKVTFVDGNVNGATAQSSLQVVTNVVRVTPTSTNGVYIVITKLDGLLQNPDNPVVKVIPPSQIVINGGKFTASVKVADIQPESGMPYAVSLCPNGAMDNTQFPPNGPPQPLDPTIPVGICIADNARFSFQ